MEVPMTTATPWALLLAKFAGNDTEPAPKSYFEDVFTTFGAGRWSVPDYLHDVSHGRVDLSGSQVFGWFTLDQSKAEWDAGIAKGTHTRAIILDWARAKATEAGVDLSGFAGVGVALNDDTGASSSGNGFLCGDDGAGTYSLFSPSVMAHEICHSFGLGDAKREGVAGFYTDRTDIMSVQSAHSAPHPIHRKKASSQPVFRMGPGLNAASMAALGWLDETRTYSWADGRPATKVTLRPLHRRDLPGTLAIRFGSFFVEYRSPSGWDARLQHRVLVHRMDDNHSVLMLDDEGDPTFSAGSTLSLDPKLSLLGSGFTIRVLAIDERAETATIQLSSTAPELPEVEPPSGPFQTPWIKWSELIGPDRALVVLDGQALTIPRGSPMHAVLRQVALHQSGAGLGSLRLRGAIRQEALSNLQGIAAAALAEEGPERQPGPDLADLSALPERPG
jgi:hypothetical protein